MSKPIIIELTEPYARELYRLAQINAYHATGFSELSEREFWNTISKAVEAGMYNKDKFHQCSSCFEPQEQG